MNMYVTAVTQIHIHPISDVVELWVEWHERHDGRAYDTLACWIDQHCLMIETQGPQPVVRKLTLDQRTMQHIQHNGGGCLVLVGPYGVVDTADFQIGMIWA